MTPLVQIWYTEGRHVGGTLLSAGGVTDGDAPGPKRQLPGPLLLPGAPARLHARPGREAGGRPRGGQRRAGPPPGRPGTALGAAGRADRRVRPPRRAPGAPGGGPGPGLAARPRATTGSLPRNPRQRRR